MSSLVKLTVLDVLESSFNIRVDIVHPDEQSLNDKPNYALQIVLDLYRRIKEGYIYNSNWQYFPYDKREARKLLSKPMKIELDRLSELMEGRRIRISKSAYDIFGEQTGTKEWKGNKVLSWGMSDGKYHVHLYPQYEQFCLEAEKYIEEVTLTHLENYPHWNDSLETWLLYGKSWGFEDEVYAQYEDRKYPTYHLSIKLKKNEVLGFIKTACSWESAIYDMEGSAHGYKPSYPKKRAFLLDSGIKRPNKEIDLWNWWNSLTETWKFVLQANLHLQSYELPSTLMHRIRGNDHGYMFQKDFPHGSFVNPTLLDLENMCRMQLLFANNCKLEGLSPLRMLKELRVLELDFIKTNNIAVLEELEKLEYLSIDYQEIKDLTSLKALNKLSYICFNPSSQSEIDLLKGLTKLLEITLNSEIIADISFLSDFKDLRVLNGSSSGLSPQSHLLLKQLKKKGVEVDWEIEEEEDD